MRSETEIRRRIGEAQEKVQRIKEAARGADWRPDVATHVATEQALDWVLTPASPEEGKIARINAVKVAAFDELEQLSRMGDADLRARGYVEGKEDAFLEVMMKHRRTIIAIGDE